MFLYAQVRSSGSRNVINSNLTPLIRYSPRRDEVSAGDLVVANSDNDSDVSGRFADICDAIADGNVNLYDCNKAIGYWKSAPKRAPATSPKKAPATK